jgi:hypothetical protein
LWVTFALLDPDLDSEYGSGSSDLIESRSGCETLISMVCFSLAALCNVLSIELNLSAVTRPNTTTNFVLVTNASSQSTINRNNNGRATSSLLNQSLAGGGGLLPSPGDELAAFAKQAGQKTGDRAASELDFGGGGGAFGGNYSTPTVSPLPGDFSDSAAPQGWEEGQSGDQNGASGSSSSDAGGDEIIGSNKKESVGVAAVVGTNGPAVAGGGQNGDVASKPPSRETTWQKLSNRIKALERNVSLSTGFLEELSLKYIRQIEELNSQLKLSGESIGALQRREEACRGKRAELERRLEEVGGELGRLGERLAGLQVQYQFFLCKNLFP